jgi:molecular chaperone DnaK (HSP70)
VLTHPTSFKEHTRQRLRQAAEAAGFTAVELLTEPEAAALHHQRTTGRALTEGTRLLVYDLGGGTFDAALFRVARGGLQLLVPPKGIAHLGGGTFDALILEDLRTKAGPALRDLLAETKSVDWRLRFAVAELLREKGKHVLTEFEEAEILLPPDQQPYHLRGPWLEEAITPSLDETARACKELLDEGQVRADAELTLLLVGGSCRLPAVGRRLRKEFPEAQVLLSGDPDLAVCRGAALRAAQATADCAAAHPRRPARPPYVVKPAFGPE